MPDDGMNAAYTWTVNQFGDKSLMKVMSEQDRRCMLGYVDGNNFMIYGYGKTWAEAKRAAQQAIENSYPPSIQPVERTIA